MENMGQTYSRLASVITDGVRSGKEQTMKHQIDIAPNNAIYIDGKRVVGQKPYGIFVTQKIDVSKKGLAEIVKRCNELLKGGYDEDN